MQSRVYTQNLLTYTRGSNGRAALTHGKLILAVRLGAFAIRAAGVGGVSGVPGTGAVLVVFIAAVALTHA